MLKKQNNSEKTYLQDNLYWKDMLPTQMLNRQNPPPPPPVGQQLGSEWWFDAMLATVAPDANGDLGYQSALFCACR